MIEKKKDLISIVMVFVCVVLLIIAGIPGEKHINVSQFVNVQYKGADGYAAAICTIDKDALYKYMACSEKKSDMLEILRNLADSFEVSTDNTDISNGDKIVINVSYDEELAKKAGVTVGEKKSSIRAKGIDKGQEIDLFKNIDIVFAGISPEAYIVINNLCEDDYLSKLEFHADKTSNISTGDEIRMRCKADRDELARNGYLVENTSHVIKADYLSSYVSEKEQIDNKKIAELVDSAEETVISQTADKSFRMMYKATEDKAFLYRSNDEVAQNVTLLDKIFMYRKNPGEGQYENFIYLIFSAYITIEEDEYPVFFVFEFSQGYVTIDNQFNISSDELEKRYDCSLSYENMYDKYINDKSDMYEIIEME